jgi:hypothetical protein
MVEFTTPAEKKKAVEAEEERQITAIEESFVKANKIRVDSYATMADGTPTEIRIIIIFQDLTSFAVVCRTVMVNRR